MDPYLLMHPYLLVDPSLFKVSSNKRHHNRVFGITAILGVPATAKGFGLTGLRVFRKHVSEASHAGDSFGGRRH